MSAPCRNRSEAMVRLLERAPDGLKSREVADALGIPNNRVCTALDKLAHRGAIARDPQTRRWHVKAGDVRFYDRGGGDGARLVATAGVTVEDLEWMQAQRDRAAAKQRARAGGVG